MEISLLWNVASIHIDKKGETMSIDDQIAAVTRGASRKSLYHFTRVKNLPAIAYFDSLYSSKQIDPHSAGERRTEVMDVGRGGYTMTINSHLRILESMMDPAYSLQQFRACLDRHVFFWPTATDCLKMLDTYTRREPSGAFAILQCDAHSLLSEHYQRAKLSKYDSGSSPRFPKHCTYRKSPEMFLPVADFQYVVSHIVPSKSSEIKEVLIEGCVQNVSKHLRVIYIEEIQAVPECWGKLTQPFMSLKVMAGK